MNCARSFSLLMHCVSLFFLSSTSSGVILEYRIAS